MPIHVHGSVRICKDPERFTFENTRGEVGYRLRIVSWNPKKGEQDFFHNAVMFIRADDKRIPALKNGARIFIERGEWTIRNFKNKTTQTNQEWHEVLVRDWAPAEWPSQDTQSSAQASAQADAGARDEAKASTPAPAETGDEVPAENFTGDFPPPPPPPPAGM